MTATRDTKRPRTIAPQDLERALAVRDLTDPRYGPHAMQTLLTRTTEALRAGWQCAVVERRSNPIVAVADCYDRLGYPADAVAREARYTRYVDDHHVLRTHTTAMIAPLLREIALATGDTAGPSDILLVCPGLVYRRDTIDRLHTGAPHQCDLWRLRRGRALGPPDLREMVARVMRAMLPGTVWRTEPRVHPYTVHGLQVDAAVNGEWVEVLECGVANPALLRDSGLDPRRWSGLAMGMGLDRLLMLRKGIPDIRLLRDGDPRVEGQMLDLEPWRPVSNQPPQRRDLSIAVDADTTPEEIGDRIRAAMREDADVLEDVAVISETPFAALPDAARERIGIVAGQKNVLLRLVIRHPSRTLTSEEANRLRDRVYAAVHEGTTAQWAAAS